MGMSKKYTVLIVDDDKFLLGMYRKKFEHEGATVDVALGAEEALKHRVAGEIDATCVFQPDQVGDGLHQGAQTGFIFCQRPACLFAFGDIENRADQPAYLPVYIGK